MWSLKGEQPKVSTPGGRQQQPIIGAVDPLLGRIHMGLSEHLKAEQFKQFLVYLVRFYATMDKIVHVVDNARVHHAKLVQDFLQERGHKIELVFLPAYSPELNPMECVWKYLRKKVTHNTFFKTFKEFLRSLITFFRKFKNPSQEIKTLCRIF